MIYPRRQYRPDYKTMLPQNAVPLEFKISCGTQKAWYVPPREADDPKTPPDNLWLMFGGNGSLALFWNDTVQNTPDDGAGFILLDYPGYGFCEGDPSPQSILESAEGVVGAVAGWMDTSKEKLLDRPVRLMGHSLGTGVALDFATRHKIDRIILFAPFTSFRAMANRVVSPMFSWMLRYHVDSLAALKHISEADSPPKIIVIHGAADDIVPVEMGREMKAKFPDLVEYKEIRDANHVNVLDGAEKYTAAEWD